MIAIKIMSSAERRKCGDCQLCCKLLAVKNIGKLAGERCSHQKFKVGCNVYNTPGMPPECGVWSCRWLVEDDTADQRRPDRSHLVIDIMPDYVHTPPEEDQQNVEVVQVWCDPKYPDAHRDPDFRAYAARRGLEGKLCLIRYSAKEAFILIPPNISPTGDWIEHAGQSDNRDHSFIEIVEALSDAGER